MTRCPDCDATVDPEASYCGNCGADLAEASVLDAIDSHHESQSRLELSDEPTRNGESAGAGMAELEELADADQLDEIDDLENVDDFSEMRALLELKRQHESQRIEAERERLQARDDVDAQTLATLDETDATLADIARIEADDGVSEERLADQEQFRDELRETMEDSMDRMERLTEHSIDALSEGDGDGDDQPEASAETKACPNCDHEQPRSNGFCANCGRVLD